MRAILEYIPLSLDLKTDNNGQPIKQQRDPELLKLFLERNFFNNLAFYIDCSNSNTVMSAVAVLNALFIRHYIDIPLTVRIYLGPLLKAITSVQVQPREKSADDDKDPNRNPEYLTELETLTFLHNILAFITLLLRSCDAITAEKKREELFQQFFRSDYTMRSLRYVYQRFLMFLTKHWYEATFSEEQLNTLNDLNNRVGTDATKAVEKAEQSGDQTEIEDQTKKTKTKTTTLTPKQSIELYYKGIETLLLPFIGYINVFLNLCQPTDAIAAKISQMVFHSRDVLYRLYATHVPLLCDGTRYYFNVQQCAVQTSFYQLYFHVLLNLLRVSTHESFKLTRSQMLVENWAYSTLLYFITAYHQSQLTVGNDIDQNEDPTIYEQYAETNEIVKTLALYKLHDAQVAEEMAKEEEEAQKEKEQQENADETTTTTTKTPLPRNAIITHDQVKNTIPRISALALTILRRSLPVGAENTLFHYDLTRALILTGLFKYLYGMPIVYPQQNVSSLYLTPEFMEKARVEMEKMEKKAAQLKEKAETADVASTTPEEQQQTDETKPETEEQKPEAEQQQQQEEKKTEEQVKQQDESDDEPILFLPGAVYNEKGLLLTISPPKDRPAGAPLPDDAAETPEDINEDFQGVLYLTLIMLKIVDYESEPTWNRPVRRHPETRAPIRDQSEFAHYFIHACNLYPFMIRWVKKFGAVPNSTLPALSWEMLQTGLLDCVRYDAALQQLTVKMVQGLKKQQFDQLDQLKENTATKVKWIHEFWTWKKKRVYFKINALKAKAKQLDKKKKEEEAKKTKLAAAAKQKQTETTTPAAADSKKDDPNATDLETAMTTEEKMRQHLQYEKNALSKLEDIDVDNKDELTTENTATTAEDKKEDKTEVVDTTTPAAAAEKPPQTSLELALDDSIPDEVKFKDLFEYPIPENFLDLTADELVMITTDLEATHPRLKEDITIYLMSKAPIQFEQQGFSFYFYRKPQEREMDMAIPPEALTYPTIFTKDYYDLLFLLPQLTQNEQYKFSVDQMMMSDDANYFTYMLSIYQRTKAIFKKHPNYMSTALLPHMQTLVHTLIQSPPLINGLFLHNAFLPTKPFDVVEVTDATKTAEEKLAFYTNCGVGAISGDNVLEKIISTTSPTDPTVQVAEHHEIILNEFGESPYIRSLDRNLLPVNLENNEAFVDNMLFIFLTEAKMLLKRKWFFDKTKMIPNGQSALALNTEMFTEVYYGYINDCRAEAKRDGWIFRGDDPDVPTYDELKKQRIAEKKSYDALAAATQRAPDEQRYDFDDSELSDDGAAAPQDVDENGHRIKPATKAKITADKYRLNPKNNVVYTPDGGVIFETQGMHVKKAERYMRFTFDFVNPDNLSKHEYQSYRFSDRETNEPGVYDYVSKARDFEREREFFIRQVKYERKQNFFNMDDEVRRVERQERREQEGYDDEDDDEDDLDDEINLVDFASTLQEEIDGADLLKKTNDGESGDDDTESDEDGEDVANGVDAADYYLRGMQPPPAVKKAMNKASNEAKATMDKATALHPNLAEKKNDDPNQPIFFEDPIPQYILQQIQKSNEQREKAQEISAKRTPQQLRGEIAELEKREDELMEEMEDIYKHIEQLETIKMRNRKVIQDTEKRLFANRPVAKDKKSPEFQRYVEDLKKFERWSTAQQDKLDEIEELLKDKALEFKAYRDILGRMEKEKEVLQKEFMQKLQEMKKNGDDTATESAAAKPPQIAPKRAGPVDSDLEDFQQDQEAAKAAWLEQQKLRKGDAANPADVVAAKADENKTTTATVAEQKKDVTASAAETKDNNNNNNDNNNNKPQRPQVVFPSNGLFPTSNLTLPKPPANFPLNQPGELTISGVRPIPTVPVSSIQRHNPRYELIPYDVPTVLPATHKYIAAVLTKPIEDDEIWSHKDNTFEWLDLDPRDGLKTYSDRALQKEMKKRLKDDPQSLTNHTPHGTTPTAPTGEETDAGDLSDVFSLLKSKKQKAKTVADVEAAVVMDANIVDPIIKQEYDMSRENLEGLHRASKLWTYELLYLHWFSYPQQAIFDMKRSMEYYLRLRLPTDFKDIVLTRGGEDLSELGAALDNTTYKMNTLSGEAAKTAALEQSAAENKEGEIDLANDDKAKKNKLGDEDKIFAIVALRHQKLLSRTQLPYLYRYIHERINNIPPPPAIVPILKEWAQSMQHMEERRDVQEQQERVIKNAVKNVLKKSTNKKATAKTAGDTTATEAEQKKEVVIERPVMAQPKQSQQFPSDDTIDETAEEIVQ